MQHVSAPLRSQPPLTLASLPPQFEQTEAKRDDVAAGIQQICPQCAATLALDEFACIDDNPRQVLYRAEISGDPESDCTVLLAQIRQWVGSGAGSVSVLGNRLEVDPGCRVEIERLNSPPTCIDPSATPTAVASSSVTLVSSAVVTSSVVDGGPPEGSSSGGGGASMLIVFAAAGGGAVAVVVCVVCACVCCCVLRRQRRKRSSRYSNDRNRM